MADLAKTLLENTKNYVRFNSFQNLEQSIYIYSMYKNKLNMFIEIAFKPLDQLNKNFNLIEKEVNQLVFIKSLFFKSISFENLSFEIQAHKKKHWQISESIWNQNVKKNGFKSIKNNRFSFLFFYLKSNKHRKSHDTEEAEKVDINIEKSSIMQGICEVKLKNGWMQ